LLALSVTGVLIVVIKGNFMSIITMDVNVGNLLIVGCALSWSTYSILIKLFEDKIPSIENVTYGSLFAALGFLPLSHESAYTVNINIALIGALLFLYLIQTLHSISGVKE
jgi:drug/metabolite transporter (DMT)-like permease